MYVCRYIVWIDIIIIILMIIIDLKLTVFFIYCNVSSGKKYSASVESFIVKDYIDKSVTNSVTKSQKVIQIYLYILLLNNIYIINIIL